MKRESSNAAARSSPAFAAVVVIVVALLASTGFVTFSQGGSKVSLGRLGPASVSVASAHSLDLMFSVNSTVISPNEGVGIAIQERNTLLESNNVSSVNDWPMQGMGLGPCGSVNMPMGIEIFQGYYTSANVSTAHPLALYNPTATYSCPLILSGVTSYLFQPLSDTAAIVGTCDPNPCFTIGIASSPSFDGYWTSNAIQGSTFVAFPPGVYTVAGGDEWGALAVVHFAVLQPDQTGNARFEVRLTGLGNGSVPIAEEPLTVTPATGLLQTLSFEMVTNATGVAVRSGMSPGAYDVSFVYNGQVYRFNATLLESGNTLLEILLPGGGYLEHVCGGGSCLEYQGVYRINYNSEPCQQQGSIPLFGRASNGTQSGELAIIMRQNSSAEICAEYSLPSSALGPVTLALKPWVGTGQVTKSSGTVSFTMTPINSTVVQPNATSITLSPGQSVAVLFTLTTTSPRGYYYLVIPSLCPDIPLSIGHEPPNVHSLDFPGAGPIPCPAFQAQVTLTGVSGADVYYMSY